MRTIFGLAILVMQSAMTGCDPNNCPVCDVQIHDAGPVSMPDLMSAQSSCVVAIGLLGDILKYNEKSLCFDFQNDNDQSLWNAGFQNKTADLCAGWHVDLNYLQPTNLTPTSGKIIQCSMVTPNLISSLAPSATKYRFIALSIKQTTSNFNANMNASIKLRLNAGTELVDFGPKSIAQSSSQSDIQSTFFFPIQLFSSINTPPEFYFELYSTDPTVKPIWKIATLAILGIP